jgi:hypothetical protein
MASLKGRLCVAKILAVARVNKMRKVLLFAVCVLFLAAGAAQADSLYVGTNYSTVYGIESGNPVAVGGGSVDISILNNTPLPYVYCVGLFTDVYVGQTYGQTSVTNNGIVNGSLVTNAPQIASLLQTYGAGGQGVPAQILQAAIWTLEYGASAFQLDTSKYGASDVSLYNSMITSPGTGTLANFYWMTPTDGNGTVYQGLVAPVPIPGAFMLLGPGLLGLVGLRKRFGM